MAKEVALTVKVDDDEFQKFVRNFNEFSEKLKSFTDKAKAGSPTDQAAKSAGALTDQMRNLLDVSKNVHSTIGKITDHFGKWSALIGGTVMMLGGGAGMFGIDRLLNSFIQRQRTSLGMGMTVGQTQAAFGAGAVFPGSPEATLRNIQLGLHGDINKRIGLQALGVFDPNKKPEQIYKDALRALPGFLKQAPPGFQIPFARQTHVTDIFGEEKILEAVKHPEEIDREIRAIDYMEKHVPKLGSEETRKLEELKNSWNAFTATVEVRLTQGVAAIAPWLTRLSKGMLETPFKTGVEITSLLVNPLGYGIGKGVEALASEETKNRIVQWSKDLQQFLGSPVHTFKERMDELNQSIWELIHKLMSEIQSLFSRTWKWITGQGEGAATPGVGGATPPADVSHPVAPPAHGAPRAPNAPAISPPPPAPPAAPGPATPPAAIPGSVFPTVPQTLQPGATGSPFADRFGNFPPSIPSQGSPFANYRPLMPSPGSRVPIPAGATPFRNYRPLPPSAPPSFNDRFGTWKDSANRAAPSGRPGTGLAALFDRHSNFIVGSLGGGARGPGGRGALDTTNWQMSRTANLVVRDVPGANIHMAAVGMSG